MEARRWKVRLKRLLPRGMLGRSLAIILTPAILVQMIAAWIFYDRHWEALTRRMAEGVGGEIALLLDEIGPRPTADSVRRVSPRWQRATDLRIEWRPGETLTPGGESGFLQPFIVRSLTSVLEQKVGRDVNIRTDTRSEWVQIGVQLHDGVLMARTPLRRLYSPTMWIFLAWMLGATLVLFTVAVIFMRNQVRPIRRLAEAADGFGKGRDVTGFKPEGASEVRQAAQSFLEMRERILRQIGQRTALLAGVSHDLRTPLTRLRLALAMQPESVEIEDMKGDLNDMDRMIDGYLAFVRGEGREPTADTDLTALIETIAAEARRAGGHVTSSPLPGVVLPLRPIAFKRCLSNLVGNAIRHGGHVNLGMVVSAHAVEITVDDNGPGIPPARREDVFRPFFRLSEADVAGGGTGLGLTIARDIARGHGGDIVLGDSPLGGLRVLVRLPI